MATAALLNVAILMLGGQLMKCPLVRSREHGPQGLDSVGMNVPLDIFLQGVLHRVMVERERLASLRVISTGRINDWMFDASKRWHATAGNPWVVLSIHPRILVHPGVVFTTENNDCPEFENRLGIGRIQAYVRGPCPRTLWRKAQPKRQATRMAYRPTGGSPLIRTAVL